MVHNASNDICSASTSDTVAAARAELRDTFVDLLAAKGDASAEEVRSWHATARERALVLSGNTTDARRRALLYYAVWSESEGNFMFPLVASHGSLWGVTHTKRVDRWLRLLLPASRRGTVSRWMEALDDIRDINRRVFVEIVSTWFFTRVYGRHPAAADVVKPDILRLYNEVHAAIEAGEPLSRVARQRIYYDVFVHEQHDIVDPGIQDAVAKGSMPTLVRILKRVRPRFAYFPRGESLRFTDFTCVDQRNREGLRALAFAEQVGPERVLAAMADYP